MTREELEGRMPAPKATPRPQRLATFKRGQREELRLEVSEYEGRRYLAARIWCLGPDSLWHPTKAGVSIRPSEVEEWIAAIEAGAELLRRGPSSAAGDVLTPTGARES